MLIVRLVIHRGFNCSKYLLNALTWNGMQLLANRAHWIGQSATNRQRIHRLEQISWIWNFNERFELIGTMWNFSRQCDRRWYSLKVIFGFSAWGSPCSPPVNIQIRFLASTRRFARAQNYKEIRLMLFRVRCDFVFRSIRLAQQFKFI